MGSGLLSRSVLVLFVGAMAVEVALAGAGSQPATRPATTPGGATVQEVHPALASGVLSFAHVADLPDGVLVESGAMRLTRDDLAAEMANVPSNVRDQLGRNQFFLLEQIATRELLLHAARAQSPATQPADTDTAIQSYLQGVAESVRVTDDDLRAFYEQNKEMMGGASFEMVKPQLAQYVLQQKQQEAVEEHIQTLGRRIPIRVAADWASEQARAAGDNPVDKARTSGRPSLVDFGASGCASCDMMTPILETLRKKYAGKANVVFVDVRDEQILAARYRIQGIPVQIFFDKDGREVFRHAGFYPQAEMEKQMAKMGVQ